MERGEGQIKLNSDDIMLWIPWMNSPCMFMFHFVTLLWVFYTPYGFQLIMSDTETPSERITYFLSRLKGNTPLPPKRFLHISRRIIFCVSITRSDPRCIVIYNKVTIVM